MPPESKSTGKSKEKKPLTVESWLSKTRLKSQEIDHWTYQGRLWAVMTNNYIVCTKIPEDLVQAITISPGNPMVTRRRVDVVIGETSEVARTRGESLEWDTLVTELPIHKKFVKKQSVLRQSLTLNGVPCTAIKFGESNPATILIPDEEYQALEPFMDQEIPSNVTVFDLVEDPETGLAAWADYAKKMQASGVVVEDIETFGPGPAMDPLDMMGLNALEGQIRLVQHSISGSGAVMIWDFGGRDARVSDTTLDRWSEIRRKLAPTVLFVHHNTKFDLSWLVIHCGVDPLVSRVYDTMLASNIFWSGVVSFDHSLAGLAKRLKVQCHDKSLQRSNWGASRLLAAQYAYAAGDVVVTDKVYLELTAMISNTPINNGDQIDLTMKLAPVVVGLNTHGYPTDTDLLRRSIAKADLDLESLIVIFEDLMDCEPSKTAEVLSQFRLLYNLNLPDTTQATLQELQHPAAKALMDIRALKMRVDYLESMAGSLSDRKPRRCFTQYNIVNPQASGRVSANAVYSKTSKGVTQFFGFNGLNPPKDGPKGSLIPSIRKIFAADPGYKIISTDLSGAHLRIALWISGQTDVLDQMVNSPDGHAHTSVAIAKQLGGKYAQFDTLETYFAARDRGDMLVKELRELAKTGIYSVINICSAQSLQKSFAEKEIFLTLDECKAVLAGLWDRLPLVKKFVYSKAKEAAQTIALTTAGCRRPSTSYKDYRTLYSEEQEEAYYDATWRYGGKSTKTKALADKPIGFARVVSHANRMRYFPIYERVNTWGVAPRVERSVAAPAVASHLWASVESTIMASAVVAFTNTFTNQGHPNCRVWAIPYDETCLHVPEDEALAAATHLSMCMQEAWDRLLPGVPGVTTDPTDMIGDSWADVH